jgi:hypothetical protein
MAKIESPFRCLSRKLIIPFNHSGRRRWALPAMLALAAILLLGTTTVAAADSSQATKLKVEGYATNVAVGVPYTGIVYALDDSDNLANYNGVVTVKTSQDSEDSAGIPVVMSGGRGVFFVAFPRASETSNPEAVRRRANATGPIGATGPTGPTGPESITASGSGVDSEGQSVALTSVPEPGIYVESTAHFVVTTNADDVDDWFDNWNSAANTPYCTDQSLAGATADSHCTLREALYAASNAYWDYSEYPQASTITFSSTAFGSAKTITVTPYDDDYYFGPMYISSATVLTGPTSSSGNLVTLSGGTANGYGTSLLYADDDDTDYPGIAVANLNFTNGDGTWETGDEAIGGAINNGSYWDDEIWWGDTMTVTNCNFTNNKGDGAGAIYNWGGAMQITGGTFSGNTSSGDWYYMDAGAIVNDSLVWYDWYYDWYNYGSAASARHGMTYRSGFNALSGFEIPEHSGVRTGNAAASSLLMSNRADLHNRGDKSSRYAAIKARREAKHSKKDALRKASTVQPALDGQNYYFWAVQELVGVTIAGNSGYSAGGFYNSGYATVLDSTIGKPPSSTTLTGNTGIYVGGLYSDCQEFWYSEGDYRCYDDNDFWNYWDGQTVIVDSTISDNTGALAGGAYNRRAAMLVAADSTFSNNTSTGQSETASVSPSSVSPQESGDYMDAGGVLTAYDARTALYSDTLYGNVSTSDYGAGAVYVSNEWSYFNDSFLGLVSTTMTANSGAYGAAIDDCGVWNCSDYETEPNYSGAEPGYGDRAYNTLITGNILKEGADANSNQNGLEERNSDSYGSDFASLSALGNYGGSTQTVVPLPGNPAICKYSTSFYDYRKYMMTGWGDVFLANDQRGYPSSNSAYSEMLLLDKPCVDSGSVQTNYTGIEFTTDPPQTVPPASAGTFAAAVTIKENGAPVAVQGVNVTVRPIFESFTSMGGSTNDEDDPGTLTGDSATTDANGVAAFNSLAIDAPLGTEDFLEAHVQLFPNLLLAARSSVRPAEVTTQLELIASSDTFTIGALDFTIDGVNVSNLTIVPGTSISFDVKTTPVYPPYYAGPLTIRCVSNCGLPSGYTVAFTPSTVAANAGAYTFTVTVTAPLPGATTQTGMQSTPASLSGTARKFGPLALALLLLPLFGTRRMRRHAGKLTRWVCLLIVLAGGLAATSLMTSCKVNLNGYFTQAPQDYNVTVTATAGTYTHTYNFTLNVQ